MGVMLWLLVPETLDCRCLYPPVTSHPISAAVGSPVMIDPTVTDQPPSPGFVQRLLLIVNEASMFVSKDWRVPALIVPFCGHMLIAGSDPLLLQYISKRYSLTLSQGTFLLTTRNSINVVLLLVILPFLSKLMVENYGLNHQRKDLYLARASQFLVAIGWALLAASPNWPTSVISLGIASLGQGSMLMLRSFLGSLVPVRYIATVYSVAGMWDALGTMVGAPLLAKFYQSGMELGGSWVGLAFYFIGLLSFSFTCLLFLIQVRVD